MRHLALLTSVIAAGVLVTGVPFAPYAAGPMSPSYTGKKPSGPTQDIYPGAPPTGKRDTWPSEPRQPRWSPRSQMTLYPDTWPTKPVNMTVSERVRQRIEQEFPNADISVSVMVNADNSDKSVIILSGLVKTEKQKQRAQNIAADTKGVTKVLNGLRVG